MARLHLPAVQDKKAKGGKAKMSALLGGYWNQGNGAGIFAATPQQLSKASYVPPWIFPGRPTKAQKEPPRIPKRWIYLAKHAKKARTRKKWNNAIQRTLTLYEKRQFANIKQEKDERVKNKDNSPEGNETTISTWGGWEWIPGLRLIDYKIVIDKGLTIHLEKEKTD